MKDITLYSYFRILNSIHKKVDFKSEYILALGSFVELLSTKDHLPEITREVLENPVIGKQTYSYVVDGTSWVFRIGIQLYPYVVTRNDFAYLIHTAEIIAFNRDTLKLASEIFVIDKKFDYTDPVEDVMKFALYGYSTILYNSIAKLYKFVKALLPENEVTQ